MFVQVTFKKIGPRHLEALYDNFLIKLMLNINILMYKHKQFLITEYFINYVYFVILFLFNIKYIILILEFSANMYSKLYYI